eukprot:jgi/Ulvmu1/11361/UM075_0021.1
MNRDLHSMLPWERHEWIMKHYQPPARTPAPHSAPIRTDMDAIREHHRFIRDDGGEVGPDSSWEERMAAKYYKKLVKEYAVVDLTRYKEGKVGMRWRTEKEVVSGKGQFECGSASCNHHRGLRSFEVPFVYKEHGETKKALVKVRLCEECAPKLYWKKTKELEKLSKLLSTHGQEDESPSKAKKGSQKSRKRSRSKDAEDDAPRRKHGQASPYGKDQASPNDQQAHDRHTRPSQKSVDEWIDELLL